MKRTTCFVTLSLCVSIATQLNAATATVTSNGDANTASTCIAPVACSLRQAINRVNTNLLTDTINFAISGAGPHVIAPTTELPILARPVVIDGYSQSGSAVNTSATGFNAVLKIQLSGANMAGGSAGLRLQDATASSIQGLSITGFGGGGRAIEANGAGVVTISGCIIGLTPAFTAAANFIGIQSLFNQTGAVRIGTLSNATPRATNLISQNTDTAIELSSVTAGAQTGASFVGHNLINVAADGVTFFGSFDSLVVARANLTIAGNVIGGADAITTATAGFIITGNRINASLQPVNILGFFNTPTIGSIGGAGALANTLSNTNSTALATPTLITHTATTDVNIDVSLNRMFVTGSGAPVGIDLGDNGISANDTLDADIGPNGLQNFPILTTATRTSATGVVSVNGTLNSLPNRSFRLVIYANPTAVRAGQFLGDSTTDVSTDASGNVSFGPLQLNFGNGATVVNNVSATATLIDTVSNLPFATSEFAASVPIQLVTPPATFTVTSVDDPGNGVCDSTCTLREAIIAANATGSATSIDEIRFNIPGVGPHTIILGSALPALTQSVTIDGYTQLGALVNTDATGVGTNAVLKIEIQPVSGAVTDPIETSNAANITIRGLSITGFVGGVQAFTGAGTRIEGCWFGARPDGTENPISVSLEIIGIGGVFGGATAAQRNVWLSNKVVSHVYGVVENNLFGVLPTGRTASSVSLADPNSRLGTNSVVRRNVFARLTANIPALELFDDAVFNDNAVGESFDGLTAFGSTGLVFGGQRVRLESTTHRIRNVLGNAITVNSAFNVINQAILGGTGKGVVLTIGGSASIRSAISGTAGLGIDLKDDGVTLNDLGDADTGPNNLQNFPVLTSAVRNGSTISVTGTLNSNGSQNFRILLCGIATEHSSLHGGCDEVLDDQTIVTTDANGNIGFSVTVENNPAYSFITATASRIVSATAEQTSEFALNIPITGFQELIFANGFEGN